MEKNGQFRWDGEGRGRGGPVILLYLSAALLLLLPSLFRYGINTVLGAAFESFHRLWGFSWFRDEIFAGRFPIHNDYLNYPHGGTHFFIDPLNALLSLPLQFILPLPVILTLLILFQCTVTGFGVFLLAGRVTGFRAGAILGGLSIVISPVFLNHLDSGLTQYLGLGFLSISLYLFLILIEERRLTASLLFPLFTFATFLSSFYFGLALIISLALLFLRHLFRNPFRSIGPSLFPLLLSMALAALLVAPLSVVMVRATIAPDSLTPKKEGFSSYMTLSQTATDLLWLFSPVYKHYFEREEFPAIRYIIYPGYIYLLLVAFGTIREGRMSLFWTISGLFFLLLSLGHFLYFGRRFILFAGHRIPLPLHLITLLFPPLSFISHPYVFILPALLFFTIPFCAGIRNLPGAGKVWARPLLLILLPVFMAMESILISPLNFPFRARMGEVPEIYERIGREKGRFAILDLPFMGSESEREMASLYSFYQTVHKKPIPYFPQEASDFFQRNPFLYYINQFTPSGWEEPDLEVMARMREGLEELKALEFRYIILHPGLYLRPEDAGRVSRTLKRLLPLVEDGAQRYAVYEIR